MYLPEAFPAVTVPSLLNAGFNLVIPAILDPDLGCSSVVTTVLPTHKGRKCKYDSSQYTTFYFL